MAALGSVQMPCPVCAEGIDVAVHVAIGERVGDTLHCIASAQAGALRGEIAKHFTAHHQQEKAMQPTVGAIVHYVSYGTPGGEYASQCRAAIISGVPKYLTAEPMDGCPNGTDGQWIASLAVLNPTGMFFNQGCPQNEDGHDGGTWHWPEQV